MVVRHNRLKGIKLLGINNSNKMFLKLPDDPKPEAGGSSTSSRTQAAEEASKRLDQVREICPDLVQEIQKDWEKKEPCKKCGDKVTFRSDFFF